MARRLFRFLTGLLLAMALSSCASLGSAARPPLAITEPRPSPALDLSKWSLRWQEEFDGSELDHGRWRRLEAGADLGYPAGVVAARATLRLDGLGHLVMSARLLGGRVEVPLLGTRDGGAHAFGYFECALRSQGGDLAAAFVRLVFASGTSIDLVRASQPSQDLAVQAVGPGLPGGARRLSVRLPGLSAQYHRFGLKWSPSGYVFYVDGVPTLASKTAITELPAAIVLGMSVDKAGAAAIRARPGYHDVALLDYIRIYQSLESEGP